MVVFFFLTSCGHFITAQPILLEFIHHLRHFWDKNDPIFISYSLFSLVFV